MLRCAPLALDVQSVIGRRADASVGRAGVRPVRSVARVLCAETAADAQATSPTAPSVLQPAVPPPSAAPTSPSENAPQEPSAQNYTPPANTGTLFAYSLASVPDMIGDPGHGRYYVSIQTTTATAPLPIAAGTAYAKIADNTSPIPTDRVFSNYNYFNHAVQTANGTTIGLSTYTIGVEKTFFCGWCSVEVKAPIATGLNDQKKSARHHKRESGHGVRRHVGHVQMPGLSAGFSGDLGRHDGRSSHRSDGGPFNAYGTTLTIDNNSVHVAPFVGFVYRPCCSNFFALGFVQADVDCNGDPVRTSFVESDPQGFAIQASCISIFRWDTGYYAKIMLPLFDRHRADGRIALHHDAAKRSRRQRRLRRLDHAAVCRHRLLESDRRPPLSNRPRWMFPSPRRCPCAIQTATANSIPSCSPNSTGDSRRSQNAGGDAPVPLTAAARVPRQRRCCETARLPRCSRSAAC